MTVVYLESLPVPLVTELQENCADISVARGHASAGVRVANCFFRENELKEGACTVCRGFPRQQTGWADSLLLQKAAHVLGTLTAAPAF